MYYIPLILMTILSIWQQKKEQNKKIIFYVVLILLTAMVCLRYGQGTDYFGYRGNYYGEDYHDEIGYYLISKGFLKIGCSFEVFTFVVAAFQMICVWKAIITWADYSMLSLLLLYPTIFLTYLFAGGRQGTVMVFFLGFMLEWLKEDKWIRYLIAVALLCTIHSMAIVLLPIVIIKKVRVKWLLAMIIVAGVSGCVIYFLPASAFSFVKIVAVQYYIQEVSFSWYGFTERVVMMGLLSAMMYRLNKEGKTDPDDLLLYKIYSYGFVITVLFFPWGMLSSRMGAPMKAVEILLLPMLLRKCDKYKKCIYCYLLCYVWVMTTKNLFMYVVQGGYIGYDPLTYPYISVFQKDYFKIN